MPAGFSGWWCERCEKPVEIEDTIGSPARCPRCHKPTAVWVPGENGESRNQKAEIPLFEPDEPTVTPENCRKGVTKERGHELFEQAKALLEDVEPYDASRAKQQEKFNHG